MNYYFDYDIAYNPAMPVVEIVVGRVGSAPSLPLIALIDSGADSTIIPLRYLHQIGARKYMDT
ncbi:MAG: hypothetical protein U0350_46220 [Caldilineaceae bacterium]